MQVGNKLMATFRNKSAT